MKKYRGVVQNPPPPPNQDLFSHMKNIQQYNKPCLLIELLSFYLDEGGGNGLHVGLGVVEGHASAADGILVLVSIYEENDVYLREIKYS